MKLIQTATSVAALMAFLAISGCAAFFQQPANVEQTKAEVETLRRDQTELLALIRELKLRLESQSESIAGMRADNNSQLRQLESKIQMLTAQLEEQGLRIERIGGNPGTPKPPDSSQGGTPGGSAQGNEASLYEAAQRDFYRGNYQLAMAGFSDFLDQFPKSDRADNAQYWIGESYYSLSDMDQAIQEFLKVRDLFPEGNKVAAATLKIGYAFLRKADSATARRYFETVCREFPGTDECSLAGEKLEGL